MITGFIFIITRERYLVDKNASKSLTIVPFSKNDAHSSIIFVLLLKFTCDVNSGYLD